MLVCVLTLLATPSFAESTQEAVDEATAAFMNGHYKRSLMLFRQIRQLETVPERRLICQWNIARSLEKLNRLDEAITVFEAYGKEVTDPVRLARAESKIKALRAMLTGAIAVSCDRPDAMVSIQGQGAPPVPCPAVFEALTVGPQIVTATLPDGTKGRTMAEVNAGRTVSAQVLFGAVAAQPVNTSSHWMWYVGGGVALAAAGIITYVLLSDCSSRTEYQTAVCFDTDC
ncbi:MAG: CDC27 family protein [Myxococcota bacterium]|nr:CDC27 family protein [Myxococcota bacterium]